MARETKTDAAKLVLNAQAGSCAEPMTLEYLIALRVQVSNWLGNIDAVMQQKVNREGD